MVIDTSAIVATIANEEDSWRYQAAILHAVGRFENTLERARILVVPFDDELAKHAFAAYRQFGKGQGHPAQLNLVDCAVYALAKTRSEPLLFKGNDFARTDIVSTLV